MKQAEQSPDINESNINSTSRARRAALRFGSVAAGAAIAVPAASWGYDKVMDHLNTPRCGAEMTDPAASYIVTGGFTGDNASATFGDENLAINGLEFSPAEIPDSLQLEVGNRTVDISIRPTFTNQGDLESVVIECS